MCFYVVLRKITKKYDEDDENNRFYFESILSIFIKNQNNFHFEKIVTKILFDRPSFFHNKNHRCKPLSNSREAIMKRGASSMGRVGYFICFIPYKSGSSQDINIIYRNL